MTKRTILLAALLFGCGDRVSLGEHGSTIDPLSSKPNDEPNTADPDTDTEVGTENTPPAPTPADPTPSDIEYIEVDETAAPVPRKIRVDANCRVTDHNGLDATGDAAQCQELFTVSLNPTSYGCGYSCSPKPCTGTVRIHLKDGRDLVRDLALERCAVVLPSVPTQKVTYGVWYSAGGS